MGLFKPPWMKNNLEKALKSVEKIAARQDSNHALDKIVWNAPLLEVRMKALEKITDSHFFGSYACYLDCEEICRYAVERITDPQTLYKVVLHRPENDHIAAIAWGKLTCEALAAIVLGESDMVRGVNTNGETYMRTCERALERIEDGFTLETILMKAKDGWKRKRAFYKLAQSLFDNNPEIYECLELLLIGRSCNFSREEIKKGHAKRRKAAERLVELARDSTEGLRYFSRVLSKELSQAPCESDRYYGGTNLETDEVKYCVDLYGAGMTWPF